MTTEKRINVLVYGTLKRGFPLNGNLGEDCNYVRDVEIKGRMHTFGPFPAVDITGDDTVHCELFDCPESKMAFLDMVEGYPDLYKRTELKLNDGTTAWIYYQENEDIRGFPLVKGGIWV